jgi:hypothetical protein
MSAGGISARSAHGVGASDASLENTAWVRLVEENVNLLDEFEHEAESLEGPAKAIAEHAAALVVELLERADVDVIANDTVYDATRHRLCGTAGRPADGTEITATLSPGFAIEARVLRRAVVRARESVPAGDGGG